MLHAAMTVGVTHTIAQPLLQTCAKTSNMASAAAALLDQLMGRTRNTVPGDGISERHYSDPDVCRNYLCGFCPSQLFTNTRSDVGPCDKVHDDILKKEFEESDDKRLKGRYEAEFVNYLEKLVRDLDKRIIRGKERIQRSADHRQKSFEGEAWTSQKMKNISTKIDELIEKSEKLGEEANVEEAQAVMMEVEDLEKERSKERSTLLSQSRVPQTIAGFEVDPGDFHEKNEICDICGCFLVIGDSQARVDAHLMGKQHLGFLRIRTTIVNLKEKERENWQRQQEENLERAAQQRERRQSHRSQSRERRRSHSREKLRSRSREKRRSRSRERRKSSRERRRSRSSDRRRSRSRERRRSRSRDRRHSHRSRSKDRNRSRSRDRNRSRSREDKKKRRSRSRERRKSDENGCKRSRSREDRRRKRSHSRDRAKKRSRVKRSRSRDRKRSRSRERRNKRSRSRDRKRSRSPERRDKSSRSRDCSRSHSRESSLARNNDTQEKRALPPDSTNEA